MFVHEVSTLTSGFFVSAVSHYPLRLARHNLETDENSLACFEYPTLKINEKSSLSLLLLLVPYSWILFKTLILLYKRVIPLSGVSAKVGTWPETDFLQGLNNYLSSATWCPALHLKNSFAVQKKIRILVVSKWSKIGLKAFDCWKSLEIFAPQAEKVSVVRLLFQNRCCSWSSASANALFTLSF